MQIEICAFSTESCLNAQQAAAHRVELCSGLYEGGTTPNYGLIKQVRELLDIELYVMIRPRGGDFCYNDHEFEQMKIDIEMAKTLQVDGVVFGILLPDGRVDIERNKALVELALPMKVTFHRAFDRALEPLQALEDVIATGAIRILTSGQKPTAPEGIDLLKTLVEKSQNRIEIMAGSGVSAQNAEALAATGVHALHLTGKSTRQGAMQYQKNDFGMGANIVVHENEIVYSAIEKIEAVRQQLATSDIYS